MKQLFLFLIFLALSKNYIAGQNHHYKMLSDNENRLIYDLYLYINDTDNVDIDFVVSPLLMYSVEIGHINKSIIKKYGFKEKTGQESNDTLMIGNNGIFEFVDIDLLIKYKHLSYTSDSITIMNPRLYYVKKEYNKGSICYFYKPVFSENKKYAIAQFDKYCGSLCGWGEIVLMENINNRWKVIDVLLFVGS